MSSREAVLAAVRQALADGVTAPEVSRDYERAPLRGLADAERFTEAVQEYAATVHRVPDTPAAVAEVVARLVGDRRVVVPHDLPDHLRSALASVVDGPGSRLGVDDLEGVHSVVTLARLGICATGTVVLDAGVGQGRRAVSLLPDHHVCIIGVDQLVDTVPQAFAALRPDAPLTFISGPSATSDIELDRVEGVHGPRVLDVVLVG